MATLAREFSAIANALPPVPAAPIAPAPVLADTIPPTEPPAPVTTAKPRQHRLMAWHHDGRASNWQYETREVAIAAMDALSGLIYWKGAVIDGRAVIARRDIPAEVLELAAETQAYQLAR
jgi:hypothetical protein